MTIDGKLRGSQLLSKLTRHDETIMLSISSIIAAVLECCEGREDWGMSESTAPVADIKDFLSCVQKEISKPGKAVLIDRQKNVDSIARLGSKWKHEILSLTHEDYNQGPLPDHAGAGEIWKFMPEIDGVMVYIKLKLDPERGVVCLLFHEAYGPSTLPHRWEREGGTK